MRSWRTGASYEVTGGPPQNASAPSPTRSKCPRPSRGSARRGRAGFPSCRISEPSNPAKRSDQTRNHRGGSASYGPWHSTVASLPSRRRCRCEQRSLLCDRFFNQPNPSSARADNGLPSTAKTIKGQNCNTSGVECGHESTLARKKIIPLDQFLTNPERSRRRAVAPSRRVGSPLS